MNKEEMIELLKTDVEGWNEFRKQNPGLYLNMDSDFQFPKILIGINLEHLTITGLNGFEIKLIGANLYKSTLINSVLRKSDMRGANLENLTAPKTNFYNSNFTRANLQNSDLQGSELGHTRFINSNIKHANFTKAHGTKASFYDSQLVGAIFKNTKFTYTTFGNVNFKKAQLQYSFFEYSHFKNTTFSLANLKAANIHYSKLIGVNFQEANLLGANFHGSEFKEVTFSSKEQLELLDKPLSKTQLSNCIFEEPQKKPSKTKNLTIHYTDQTEWSVAELTLLLHSIQSTYNKVFYLCSNTFGTIDEIENSISENNITPSDNFQIYIKSINSGSLELIIQTLVDHSSSPLAITLISLYVIGRTIDSFFKHKKTLAEIKHIKSQTKLNEIDANTKEVAKTLNLIKTPQITDEQKNQIAKYICNTKEFNDALTTITSTNPNLKNNTYIISKCLSNLIATVISLYFSGKENCDVILPSIDNSSNDSFKNTP
ncbi:pentapeptide repeat-containing protein [Maridesulfovibrio sp.]|uniref:pentapeptide repeat-containing protein n=1 Tax=Maridesulfovibrio sp. TaxID=2795000 RepID=UPI0039EEE661